MGLSILNIRKCFSLRIRTSLVLPEDETTDENEQFADASESFSLTVDRTEGNSSEEGLIKFLTPSVIAKSGA